MVENSPSIMRIAIKDKHVTPKYMQLYNNWYKLAIEQNYPIILVVERSYTNGTPKFFTQLHRQGRYITFAGISGESRELSEYLFKEDGTIQLSKGKDILV